VSFLDWIARAESGGNVNAQNPLSSASGLFQITTGTFNSYAPRLGISPTMRNDPGAQYQIAQAIQQDAVRAVGRPLTAGESYGAHFLGVAGLRAFVNSPSTADAFSVYSSVAGNRTATAAFNSNPGLLGAGMTVGQVMDALGQRVARYSGGAASGAGGIPGMTQTSGGTPNATQGGATPANWLTNNFATNALSAILTSIGNWISGALGRIGFLAVGFVLMIVGLMMFARSR
jgi:hypothetical protein